MKGKAKTSFLSIILAVLTCAVFCLSGCVTGFGKVQTDDERYEALAKATQDFFDYDGKLTIKMKCSVQENDSDTENIEIIYAIDPAKEIMYCKIDSNYTDVEAKVFKSGGEHYILRRVETTTSTAGSTLKQENEEYTYLSDESVKYLTSLNSFQSFYEYDFDSLLKEYLYSFTQTKVAYESVYAEQLAERIKTDDKAHVEFNMKTQKVFNSISYEEYHKIKLSGFSKNNKKGTFTEKLKGKMVGKRGKLSQVKVSKELSFVPSQPNSDVVKEKISVVIDIDYTFNKLRYAMIKTDLPEEVCAFPYSEEFRMRFNVNGMVQEKNTTAYAFNPEYIFTNLTKDFYKTSCSIEWYKDSAYTQPLIPKDLTYDEFHKIDCVYGKMNVGDGYAVIAQDYKVGDRRTDEYKAVFGPIIKQDESYEMIKVVPVSSDTTYALPIMTDEYESFVNGEKYDENSNNLNLESGKFYYVEFIESKTNEDFSIFDIDFSSLWSHGDGVLH